MGIYYIFI